MHFEQLPDEIILKVLSHLEAKDLIRFGQVSKRIHTLSNEEYSRQTINVYRETVPAEFIGKLAHA